MSVSEELLCAFELLRPLDGNALRKEMTKAKRKRSVLQTCTLMDFVDVHLQLDRGWTRHLMLIRSLTDDGHWRRAPVLFILLTDHGILWAMTVHKQQYMDMDVLLMPRGAA
jgi:hypothetical protein